MAKNPKEPRPKGPDLAVIQGRGGDVGLKVPQNLTPVGAGYYHDLVRAASPLFTIVDADVAFFQAAALSYERVQDAVERVAKAKAAGDDKAWVEAQKFLQGAQRTLRADLRTIRLTPDWRSEKAARRTQAEEVDDDGWGDLLE